MQNILWTSFTNGNTPGEQGARQRDRASGQRPRPEQDGQRGAAQGQREALRRGPRPQDGAGRPQEEIPRARLREQASSL